MYDLSEQYGLQCTNNTNPNDPNAYGCDGGY